MFDSFKSFLEPIWSRVSYREPQRVIIPSSQQYPAIQPVQPSTSASVLVAASEHRTLTKPKKEKSVVVTQPKTSVKAPPILVAKRTLTASQSQPKAITPDSRQTKVHSEVQHAKPSPSTPFHPVRDKRPIPSPVVTSQPKRVELDRTTSTSSLPAYIQSNIDRAFTDRVKPNEAQEALSTLSIPTGKRRPAELKKGDLATIEKGRWLNDVVINASLSILQRQASQHGAPHKIQRFDSFEIERMSRASIDLKNYQHITSLKDYDFMIFPINKNENHWLLIVVDVKNKSIFSVDSLNAHTQNRSEVESIKTGLTNVYTQKQDQTSASQVKALTIGHKQITRQTGGSDCGPAMIKIATYFYQENGKIPEGLKPGDYTNFRETIKQTLRGCSFIEEPSPF